jgi:uncharacterized protein YjbI with pentapeptide repeats
MDDLRADCARCFGLCCVVPEFAVSADFAIDKPARTPCPNLAPDFGCGIHESLRERGFPGCQVYDCFGAGQQIAQVTFGGRDWRAEPDSAPEMFAVFPVMRDLHELLWYLRAALALPAAAASHPELRALQNETERLTAADPVTILAVDVSAHRARVNTVLSRASEAARARWPRSAAALRGADLIGRDLRRRDFRGANLRGARLIGADLRRVDLSGADLTGTDLRAADLCGADLAESLFLTQAQLVAARGDTSTALPDGLSTPAHWR